MINKRVCRLCKKNKPVSEFTLNRTDCKICHREQSKAHYRKNKSKYRVYQKNRRARVRKFFAEYKASAGCAHCHIDNPVVLEFHHKLPGTKEFQFNDYGRRNISMDRLKLELEKCIVICANCHRIEHDRLRKERGLAQE